MLAECWQSVGRVLAEYWQSTGRVLAGYWQSGQNKEIDQVYDRGEGIASK